MAPASSKIEYPKHFYNAQVSGDRSITAYAVLISILKGLGEASDLVESLGLHPTSFLLIDKAGKERICNRIVEGANKLTLQFNAAVKIAAPIRNEFGYNYAEVELFTDEPGKYYLTREVALSINLRG